MTLESLVHLFLSWQRSKRTIKEWALGFKNRFQTPPHKQEKKGKG
jgi:hypothetical protein